MAALGPFRCSKCNEVEDPISPLKCCGSCKKLRYCSRACQKAHWKGMHKEGCNKPRHHMDENWPEQQMPARIYPRASTRTTLTSAAYPEDFTNLLLLNKDEPTTYKPLIESFRAWYEVKRGALGAMVDPRDSYRNGSVKYNTGYLFQGLLEHIANAEKIAGTLPS
ncbi:hypothetical protein BKA58DRAFT_464649 [Alternaria rosae]|uniref:uncharacterized protein n=1 Tax=Alternaria rosae TaxID=1187941 RepID=UPI001E8DC82F|nr:uncharacterized protein BKA58DRAFT_464649 [Alternaria rosae]KAH6882725.1 hypothetical protein BKA58DRAFT_464649 [Alternaria rosae]